MINIRELMVDNWVSDKKGEIKKLLTIGQWCSYKVEQGSGQVRFEFLEPIPLTHELLEKCGFANMSKEDKEELGIPNTERLVYADSAICCHWDGVEFVFHYGLDSDLAIAACEYLHQLQNLIFSLTQTELNIQL